ncbi:DMT family transporter [Geobacter sp.]|uniref:DMT family transporter n=1 Tax=Geobacter sp. TaxID=46610 RepID=UPI0026211975|nr:DMT family transporter [Geobacter sp.]
MNASGNITALLSAVLFGVSPVACKAVAGEMPAASLAGLLYLGSGMGLSLFLLLRRQPFFAPLRDLSPRQLAFLGGAILSGGIVAPLFLAYGIKYGTAGETSLLLNFEAVATTLLAAFVFHEHVGLRVWGGKFLVVAGAVVLVVRDASALSFSVPGLAVLAACLLWGIDNNLTRELEELPATVLAAVKGLSAGAFNILVGTFLPSGTVTLFQTGATLVIGALSYGVSLVLFIQALRLIGSARTATWFASGPFVGTLLSVTLLGEKASGEFWLAAGLMLAGVLFLFREEHAHHHEHEELAHNHPHLHDEHHRHPHDDEGEPEGAHAHFHVHEALVHTHVHWPDIHHRHRH